MVVVSHRHRVVYVPTPKVACSSVKSLIFGLETDGDRPADALAGTSLNVHDLYRSVRDGGELPPFAPHYFSFVVVREPLERFVSAYRNRVLHFEELDRQLTPRMRRLGLREEPGFEEFVDRFPAYFNLVPTVRHHFAPQSCYIRHAIGRVDKVYALPDLGPLEDDLSHHVGAPVSIPRLQTGGSGVPVEVSAAAADRIRSYLADDYSMFERARAAIPRPLGPGAPVRRSLGALLASELVAGSVPVRAVRRLLR